MKTNKKILPVILLIGVGMAFSCKKDKPGMVVKTGDSTTVIIPVPGESGKKLLPVQLGSGKSKMTFSYTANHSISKIEYADGSSTELNYTKTGLPFNLTRYNSENQMTFTSEYELDGQGRIIRADHYDMSDGDFNIQDYFIPVYTSSSQPSALRYYNSAGKLMNELQISYSAGGNRIYDQSKQGNLLISYVYDDKNGLFKNAGFAWLLAVEKENPLFYSLFNNISTSQNNSYPNENRNFSYTYNADMYPSAITITGLTANKVTYQTVN